MSEHAQSFIKYLIGLKDRERGAIAQLKRSLGLIPGSDWRVFPYVERFVGDGWHAEDPRRQALYLAAGLFALNSRHRAGESFAAAFGRSAKARDSASIERRFVALLGAEPEYLHRYLRQAVSMLAADEHGFDFVLLLGDLSRWLDPYAAERRDELRQRWARDFYRAYDPHAAPVEDTDSALPDASNPL